MIFLPFDPDPLVDARCVDVLMDQPSRQVVVGKVRVQSPPRIGQRACTELHQQQRKQYPLRDAQQAASGAWPIELRSGLWRVGWDFHIDQECGPQNAFAHWFRLSAIFGGNESPAPEDA